MHIKKEDQRWKQGKREETFSENGKANNDLNRKTVEASFIRCFFVWCKSVSVWHVGN